MEELMKLLKLVKDESKKKALLPDANIMPVGVAYLIMSNNEEHRLNVSASSSPSAARVRNNERSSRLINLHRISGANAIGNNPFLDMEMNSSSSSSSRNVGHGDIGRLFIRGTRRLGNRDRLGNFYYDSPGTSRDHQVNVLEGVPSSPDGFSSDSMMDDDHDMSDGMSSVSDLEGRIHLDFPENVAPDNDFLSAEYPLRRSLSLKVSRGGKRTRTGSHSSNSSFERVSSSRKSTDNPKHNLFQGSFLIEALQKLRNNNEFTDVSLVVKGTEIHCHRVVLAACSPYFHALLSSSMREVKEGKIAIQGHTADTLNILVRYAYAESVTITTANAQDVLEAADYFQMDALKRHCEGFLIHQVSESNCLGLEQFASLHTLGRLHRKARKFAMKNFTKVSKREEFLRLGLHTVAKYLSDDQLSVLREEHVYEAALRWLEHDESRKEHAAVILRAIRLFYVRSRFLFEVVSKNSLFQNDTESQKIIAEACKYHALGGNEWKHSKLPHARPRVSSGIREVLVVVGGICNNRRLLYTECYDAAKREWTSLSEISTPHASMHSYSVCAHKNDIYITGGHSNSGMTVDTVSMYISCINQWSMLASMHYPRERHGSASVDGTVYVAGGLMASTKNRKKPGVLNSVERYRPMCNRWEKVKPLPKRCYSPGVLSYKEKLYVIGGVSMTEDTSNSSKVILDCIQCFDPLTESWSQLPLGRALARLSCASYNDHFYMISNNATSVFRYNPATTVLEEWKELNEVNVEFAGLAAFNDKLVISGGQKGSTTLNHMYMIDFDSGKVEEEAKMKRSRCMHGCVPIDKYG